MRRGFERSMAVGMAGVAMVLGAAGCRDAEEDPGPAAIVTNSPEGSAGAAAVAPASSSVKVEAPAKLPRTEGRKPDGRPAPKVGAKYRVAVSIPGKPGFVFNPYTNNPVDVRGLPPGTLVRDPQDPDTEHKFRTPKASAPKAPDAGPDGQG